MSEPVEDPYVRIRLAISRLGTERDAAARAAAGAATAHARLDRACAEQLAALARARREIAAGRDAAERARIADPDGPDAAPYDLTATGLADADAALSAAERDLQRHRVRSGAQSEDVRAALVAVARDFESAVREQVRLLGELERRHRAAEADRLRRRD